MSKSSVFTTMRVQRLGRLSAVTAAVALITGCATVSSPNPDDPWERYNRSMDKINYNVDQALVRPIANTYKTLTPQPARTCISNMFRNLGDVWSATNSFIQGRPHDFANTLGRVLFNTTMGVGGCFDVASKNGSTRIPNDFGTTLGVWGLGAGPYVVLPLIGPSTVRDSAALGTALAVGFNENTPVMSLKNVRVRNAVLGVYFVDLRAGLLDAEELVNDIALDRYSFIRDAYLQRRQSLVNSKLRDPLDNSYGDTLPDYEDFDDEEPNSTTPAPLNN